MTNREVIRRARELGGHVRVLALFPRTVTVRTPAEIRILEDLSKRGFQLE